MAADKDLSKLTGPTAEYRVDIDPLTQKTVVVTTALHPSGPGKPAYIYVDPQGNWRGTLSAQEAINAFRADIKKSGITSAVAKKMYDATYLSQKGFTSNNAAAFNEGLRRYIIDFNADQLTKIADGEANAFQPFGTWVNSSAGSAAAIGKRGSVTTTTTTSALTSPAQAYYELDNFMFDQIGRKATAAEKKAYLDQLNTEENKAAITRKASSTTITGPDSQATTAKDQTIGAGGLTQADHDRILNSVVAPVVQKMSTDELMKTNGSIAQGISDLLATAADYGLTNYTADIAKNDIYGKMSAGGVVGIKTLDMEKQNIKSMAIGLYPNLANMINQGVKISSIGNLYAQQMQKTLEVPWTSVKADDPFVVKALQNKDANGKSQDGVMSLNDFNIMLRNDSRWATTQNAKEEASNYANTILKQFGFMG